jgi:hypothetical protein
VIFERIGRIFAPSAQPSDNIRGIYKEPSDLVEKQEVKGRAMVGYSRRGFLGMLGVAAVGAVVAPEIGKWGVDLASGGDVMAVSVSYTELHNGETLIAPTDYFRMNWPITVRGPFDGLYRNEALTPPLLPWKGPLAGQLRKWQERSVEHGARLLFEADQARG